MSLDVAPMQVAISQWSSSWPLESASVLYQTKACMPKSAEEKQYLPKCVDLRHPQHRAPEGYYPGTIPARYCCA